MFFCISVEEIAYRWNLYLIRLSLWMNEIKRRKMYIYIKSILNQIRKISSNVTEGLKKEKKGERVKAAAEGWNLARKSSRSFSFSPPSLFSTALTFFPSFLVILDRVPNDTEFVIEISSCGKKCYPFKSTWKIMKKVEERDFLDRRRGGKNRRKGVATAGESGGPSRQSESSQELLTPSSILSPPLDLESQPSPWFNVPPPSGRRKQGRSLFCDPSQIQIPPSSPLIVFIIDRLWHPIISMLFLYFLCNICVYISRERSWLFWKRCKKKEHGNIGLLLARRRRRKDTR